jgi:hypothetical protein
LERGEATHMMPVENAKEKLRKKEIKLEDIPYMQRGGSWVCVMQNIFDTCSFFHDLMHRLYLLYVLTGQQ